MLPQWSVLSAEFLLWKNLCSHQSRHILKNREFSIFDGKSFHFTTSWKMRLNSWCMLLGVGGRGRKGRKGRKKEKENEEKRRKICEAETS